MIDPNIIAPAYVILSLVIGGVASGVRGRTPYDMPGDRVVIALFLSLSWPAVLVVIGPIWAGEWVREKLNQRKD